MTSNTVKSIVFGLLSIQQTLLFSFVEGSDTLKIMAFFASLACGILCLLLVLSEK